MLAPGGIFVTLELFRPDARSRRARFIAPTRTVVLPAVGGLVVGRPRRVRVPRAEHGGLRHPRGVRARCSRARASRTCAASICTLGIASIVRGSQEPGIDAMKQEDRHRNHRRERRAVREAAPRCSSPRARARTSRSASASRRPRPRSGRSSAAATSASRSASPIWGMRDYKAPFASGSAGWHAMVVVPCSMGTAARIAHGISRHAPHARGGRDAQGAAHARRRAARDAALASIHLENLHGARARRRARPAGDALVLRQARDARATRSTRSSARILDHLGLEHDARARAGERR